MGKVDLPLIMKIVALIACSCAVGINVSDNASGDYYRIPLVSNSFIYAVGAYLIILAFFFLWVILRSDVDKKFAAIILFFGAIWNVGAGIGVIIYHADYTLHSLQLVAGILGLVAGVIMFIDVSYISYCSIGTLAVMGKGNGFEMNLDMILRIIELILLTVAMILFLINSDRNPEILTYAHTYSVAQGDDAMNMSASIFIIVLVILVCMKLFKDEELDQEFVGWLAIVGTALLIPTGIVVCINYRNGSGSIIISGIMAIVAGCCLLVEALKDLGVF